MKKLFAILLTLAMVLSLAACGGGDSGKTDAPADGGSQQQEPAQTPPTKAETRAAPRAEPTSGSP